MKISIQEVTKIFRTYLKQKGLRYTPERERIIIEIFQEHEHFDVEELYLKIRAKKLQISKASIYRVIPHLLECELIRESYTEDGHQHYEQIYGHTHHDHLRCLGCGKIIEFMDETIENAQQDVGKRFSFVIVNHIMEIVGYCKKCAKQVHK